MSDEQKPEVQEFAASFKGFMDRMVSQAPPAEDAFFLQRLRTHFQTEPAQLPVLREKFPQSEHPNLHTAFTNYLAGEGRSAEVMGIARADVHREVGLIQLTQRAHNQWYRLEEGPVEYVNIQLNDDQVLACIQSGLYLVRDQEKQLAVLIQGPSQVNWQKTIQIEVMAPDHAIAEAFLRSIRTSMRQLNVYRGKVISLSVAEGGLSVNFHQLPSIPRAGIVLPANVLERIERQTIGFAKLAPKLQASGRHLKRGLLLYGPPGTGKTLTAMYLAGQMSDRTIILLTGSSIGLIEQSCLMARLLQPATIILEDVDLIAEERTHQSTGTNAVLFELLNQMDGLAEDADILFLLTTNRPEILEPALAARPGRIDQAMEIPLPDYDGRHRLFQLYSQGMKVKVEGWEQLYQQTEGVSAAFIRELMRRSALLAADESEQIVVTEHHITEALHELVFDGGALTKQLLGAGSAFSANPRREEDC
jgi:hypothetical protein